MTHWMERLRWAATTIGRIFTWRRSGSTRIRARRRHRRRGRARWLLCPAHLRAGRAPRCRRHRARVYEPGSGRARLPFVEDRRPRYPPGLPLDRPARPRPRLPLPTRLSPRMAPASGPRPHAVRRPRPRRRRGWTRLSRGQGPAVGGRQAQGREQAYRRRYARPQLPIAPRRSRHAHPQHRPLRPRPHHRTPRHSDGDPTPRLRSARSRARTVVSPQPNNRANTTTCAKSGAKFRLAKRIAPIGLRLDQFLPKDLAESRFTVVQQVAATATLAHLEQQIGAQWFEFCFYPVVRPDGGVS